MIKNALFILIFLFSALTAYSQLNFGEAVKIDDAWKFQKGDPKDAAKPGFDDSRWRTLDLPHDWSIEGPLSPNLASATGYLPGGVAWYRKTLEIPPEKTGNNVFICFGGIYRNGEVFINGKSVGMRPNGYISCYYEITSLLKFGEKNLIAVRVDHSKAADSRWYTGSGIYRDAYLVYANPVHIDPWGIFFTTQQPEQQQTTAVISTSLSNGLPEAVTVTIEQELTDPQGRTIARVSGKIKLLPLGKDTLTLQMKVKQPQLWSPDNPFIYTLNTRVLKGKVLADRSELSVGFRTLRFDADKGFFLNGNPLKVKGVCLHHDAGCLGSAVPREVWEYRLNTLKSLGCNAIRTSHNPESPVFYELCDRLGFLVMDEAFDEWEFPKKKWLEGWNVGTPGFEGASEFFKEWGETDLRDMILRDRNHPSVFMWSIGNEVDYPNDPYSHPILNKEGIQQQHTAGYLPDHPNAERLGVIAQRLASVVQRYDTSRPVTAGLAGPVMSNETAYPGALDVVGYNYTENRYAMDHARYPARILYGSENGQSLEAWKAVADNEYIFGQFLWTGIDYLGESHAWPSRGFTSGLIDLAGFRKPRAWFRQSLWLGKPMIYAGTIRKGGRERISPTDAPPVWNYQAGDTVRVICFTNCPNAQVTLNGEKCGESKSPDPQRGFISWEIPYKPGKLEVTGISPDQQTVSCSLQTCKRPSAIRAETVKDTILSDKGVGLIKIQITDEDGKAVFLAEDEITCTVSGGLKLLGMEAGNSNDMGDYTDNRQRVFQGKMIVYVQSLGKKGTAKVTFESPWLKKAEVALVME
jgi:beta-galactosidase